MRSLPIINRGRDTIEIVNTVSEDVLVHIILQHREDVGSVVGGVRIVKDSSMAVRRRG